MTIHVVMGPPMAGKTTFVRANAAKGVPRFDLQSVANTVAGYYLGVEDDVVSVPYIQPQSVLDAVLAMRRGFMGWLLDPETQIEELWLVNSRPSENTIQRLAGVSAQFHIIDPGKEECIARAQRAGRDQAVLDAITAWYADPPELPEQKGDQTVKTKSINVQVKAGEADELPAGQITAYASVFDTIDSYGDVVRKGAFTDTLAEWKASGNVLPLLYGHDFRDPWSNIGGVTEAIQDDHGLKITAVFDMDNEKAAQVYKLVKEKRLSQMSFAFNVLEGGWAEVDGTEVYELRKLKLHEVSVVPIGANPDTEILDAKAPADNLIKALLDALERAAPGSRQKEPDKPTADPDNPTTPEETSSGVSHSKGESLTARLLLLERTHHESA